MIFSSIAAALGVPFILRRTIVLRREPQSCRRACFVPKVVARLCGVLFFPFVLAAGTRIHVG